MAELYFNFLMKQCGAEHSASSAGLSAFAGGNISGHSAEVLAENGIDSSHFRSSALTRYALDEADMVITMTGSHKDAIVSCCPEYAGKVKTLLDGMDVPDPYGGTVDDYRAVFLVIKDAVARLAKK